MQAGDEADIFRRSWADGAGPQLIRAVDRLEHSVAVPDANIEAQEDAGVPVTS